MLIMSLSLLQHSVISVYSSGREGGALHSIYDGLEQEATVSGLRYKSLYQDRRADKS